jgi:hypothetical protein
VQFRQPFVHRGRQQKSSHTVYRDESCSWQARDRASFGASWVLPFGNFLNKEEEIIMKPHILSKSHLVLWIAVATGWPAQAVHAEPFIRAVAEVNSRTVFATNSFILPPPSGSGAGVSVAGAHVFVPEKLDYRVSNALGYEGPPPLVTPTDRGANDSEKIKIRNLVDAILKPPIATDNQGKKQYEANVNLQLSRIVPDNNANPKVFPEIKKLLDLNAPKLAANTGKVSNPPSESAQSSASQTAEHGLFGTQIRGNEKLTTSARGASAVAVAINRDPLPVSWNKPPSVSLSLGDLTSDPSNPQTLSLTAQAPSDGKAAAFHNINVSLKDFSSFDQIPTNIPAQDALEASAQTLFDLSVLLVTDGTKTTADFTFDLAPGASILDNFGDSTSSALTDRLNNCATTANDTCPVSIANGVLSFTKDFSFSVALPSNPDSSLLFLRDSATAVSVVPEPGTRELFAVGLIGFFWFFRIWRGNLSGLDGARRHPVQGEPIMRCF